MAFFGTFPFSRIPPYEDEPFDLAPVPRRDPYELDEAYAEPFGVLMPRPDPRYLHYAQARRPTQSAPPPVLHVPDFLNPRLVPEGALPTKREMETWRRFGAPQPPGPQAVPQAAPQDPPSYGRDSKQPAKGKTDSVGGSPTPPSWRADMEHRQEFTKYPYDLTIKGGSLGNNFDRYFQAEGDWRGRFPVDGGEFFIDMGGKYNANPGPGGQSHFMPNKLGGGFKGRDGWEYGGYVNPYDPGIQFRIKRPISDRPIFHGS